MRPDKQETGAASDADAGFGASLFSYGITSLRDMSLR
jgi:hypothetical protein